jgi:hypothetical protein
VPLTADGILYIPDAEGTRAILAEPEKLLIFGGAASAF